MEVTGRILSKGKTVLQLRCRKCKSVLIKELGLKRYSVVTCSKCKHRGFIFEMCGEYYSIPYSRYKRYLKECDTNDVYEVIVKKEVLNWQRQL